MRKKRRARVLSAWMIIALLVLALSACEEEEKRKAGEGAAVSEKTESVSHVKEKAESSRPRPVKRPDKEKTTPSGGIKLEAPVSGFHGAPEQFTWYIFPGAATYEFVLLDPDLTVLYEGPPFPENIVSLPMEAKEFLEEGKIFYWRVVARNDAGEVIGESPYRDFLWKP